MRSRPVIKVTFNCRDCPATRLIFEGDPIDLPEHMGLAALIVAAEDAHDCRPAPVVEEPERTPY